MTNPQRICTAIIGVHEAIGAVWDLYEQVEAALLPSPLRGTSYDGAGGHGSTIPDPTGQLATELTSSGHGIHNRADTLDALEAILTQSRWVQTRVNTLIRQHPDLARDIDATRATLICDGTYDPLCKANVYKAGKCRQCYNNDAKARQRARERRTPVDTSTCEALASLAYDPRPVEPQLPEKVWCEHCPASYYTDGEEPTAWLAAHIERTHGR